MLEEELREWAPMNDLLSKIPAKVLIGLFQHDVKLTCVDAIKEMIVLGTNLGIVYLYDRRKMNLQRLRSDTSLYTPITIVKIISSVDYMIAAGAKDGKVTIYQIPKEHPDSIPDILKPKNLHAERYVVADMHKDQVTALEWSKNAMKLFSGDKRGSVILTEFDYQMHLSKSVEIINDTYEIVQLSYSQQILLVSTQYRSIVCQKCDKWIISQVGKKVRKTLGIFGGIFYQKTPRAKDVVLFCSRPGLRLWESDLEGTVQNTLIFKDILTSDCPEITILNPISPHLRSTKPRVEPTFGVLLPFCEDLLVTYSSDSIYVINPKELQVFGVVQHLRNILGVATDKDEIFILEGERMLLRISYRPENESNKVSLAATTKAAISKNLHEITYKTQPNSDVSALDQQSEASSIFRAEEALESPQKTNPNFTLTEPKAKIDMYNHISSQDFDETILFKRGKRKKHSRASLTSNQDSVMTTSTNSNSSDDRDVVTNGASAMTVSAVSVFPDMRSAECIRSDIEEKERMLADILHFGDVKIDISRLDLETTSSSSNKVASKVGNQVKKTLEEFSVTVANGVKRSLPKDIVNAAKPPEQLLDDSFDSSVEDMCTQRIRLKSETDTLLCRNVPKDWDLSRVLINSEDSNRPASDANLSSFSDWEVL